MKEMEKKTVYEIISQFVSNKKIRLDEMVEKKTEEKCS